MAETWGDGSPIFDEFGVPVSAPASTPDGGATVVPIVAVAGNDDGAGDESKADEPAAELSTRTRGLTPELAELYLLASILVEPELVRDVPSNQALFGTAGAHEISDVVRTMVADKMPVDVATVDAKLETKSARRLLKRLTFDMPTLNTEHVETYIEIVSSFASRRMLREAAGLVAQAAVDGSNPTEGFAMLEAARAGVRVQHRNTVDGETFFTEEETEIVPVWGTPDRCAWASGEGLMLCGSPGVGKTTTMGELLAGGLGLIDEVWGMPVHDMGRVGYIAADRPRQILRAHARVIDGKEHAEVLREKLVVQKGPFPVDLAVDPEQLVRWAVDHRINTVFVDSLKDLAVGLSVDEIGSRVNRAFQLLTAEGIDLVVGHHQRKNGADGGTPSQLKDVYGSTWLTSGMGSVIYLGGDPGAIEVKVKHLKQPATPIDDGGLRIVHDHDTGRSTVEGRVDPLKWLQERPSGATVVQLAAAMSGPGPDTTARKRAERHMNRLVAQGLATKVDGKRGGPMGSTPAMFYPVSPDEGAGPSAELGDDGSYF